MKDPEIIFEEKQYMGHNRLSIVIRLLLAMFCFIGYYWSQNPKPVQVSFFTIGSYPIQNPDQSGIIFFVLGLCILTFSAALTYVLHISTRVINGALILDGFWTARKVKIDLHSIVGIRKARYKKNLLRRSVYNLHNKGVIRFYTSGDDFIELTDKTGIVYRIGSQKVETLFQALKKEIKLVNI
jgi:hypothetical protein